ncbi:unnamed protein product [Malus baccata var. baccata]
MQNLYFFYKQITASSSKLNLGYIFLLVISNGFDLLYDRTTRQSTPCSLIWDPDTIRTPGSTTRPTSSAEANRRIQNSSQRHIPTAHDMNEFFAGAEEEMQKKFIEKYNYDPVNDKPLPGRYEWEKVDP